MGLNRERPRVCAGPCLLPTCLYYSIFRASISEKPDQEDAAECPRPTAGDMGVIMFLQMVTSKSVSSVLENMALFGYRVFADTV